MPGPFQLKVAPGIVELPVIVVEVPLQLIVPLVMAEASGKVVLLVTVVTEVFVHPLPGSVTVSV